MAATLVLDAHGQALRALATHTGQHFQGLHGAARLLRRQGILDNRLTKKLALLDAAASITRHITTVSVANLIREIEQAFGGGGQEQSITEEAEMQHIAMDVELRAAEDSGMGEQGSVQASKVVAATTATSATAARAATPVSSARSAATAATAPTSISGLSATEAAAVRKLAATTAPHSAARYALADLLYPPCVLTPQQAAAQAEVDRRFLAHERQREAEAALEAERVKNAELAAAARAAACWPPLPGARRHAGR